MAKDGSVGVGGVLTMTGLGACLSPRGGVLGGASSSTFGVLDRGDLPLEATFAGTGGSRMGAPRGLWALWSLESLSLDGSLDGVREERLREVLRPVRQELLRG